MNSVLAEHRTELEALCCRYSVRRLELFGSAATGLERTGGSDLDFLVEFGPLPHGGYADAYFGLLESLEALYGRPVDLVVASAIRNPFFRQSVEQTRTLLYAA
jgi:predicted nucleotidyltransferase